MIHVAEEAGLIPPVEVSAMLVLSTAHLRESTCNEWLSDERPSCYSKGDVGWFVYAGSVALQLSTWDDPDDNVPNELIVILDYARSLNCEWVMFDRDGPVQPGLVVYDW